jgi:HAD superfamily hydrolase (TIGR01509 family)
MKEIKCALFDMDGVVIDTESQYDIFWKHKSDKYNTGIPNFEKVIKGTTLHNILSKYFSELSEEETQNLVNSLDEFEVNMQFDEIPGAYSFIDNLKKHNIKIGLVTSSLGKKMDAVYDRLHFDKLFDTVVTGTDVTKSKPNPEGYLLAAKRLGMNPENCIVFEDSFAGIEAGKAAQMTVIGLYTTHPKERIDERNVISIPNFNDLTFEKLKELMR